MNRPQILEDAIEGLYLVFSGYPLPDDTEPCGCCHSPGANELLHMAPLRELEWTQLSGYASEALTVWGDLECFKHFLPRIFDLITSNPDWRNSVPDPEIVFGKFQYGEWRTWPEDERTAVQRLLVAIWEAVRSNQPIVGGYIDVDQWLCSISKCEDDLNPYLEQWMKDERLSASWALSSLVLGSELPYTGENHAVPVFEDDETRTEKIRAWFMLPKRGAFWDGCDAQYAQLQEWVRSPAALEKLRRAEIECGDEEMAREFAAAQLCVREARSTKFERVYRERLYQTAYWESRTYRLY